MRSLLKKIFLKFSTKTSVPKYQKYLVDGNLIVGENSNIDNLNLTIYNSKKNQVNIEIGEGCLISGSIVVYNPTAKVVIGDRVFIGENTEIYCKENIIIGSDVMLSWGITLIDTNAHSLNWEERKNDVLDWKKGPEFKKWNVVDSSPIKIENKSWIGFKSIILKGVILHEGTIVGAGSVVTKSTEPYTVVGGNPARLIKRLTNENI